MVSIVSLVGMGAAAADTITIKETPIMLQQEGSVYVAPNGATSSYYYYSPAKDYICTTNSVASVTAANTISVKINGTPTDVSCYPSSTFVVTP